MTFKILNSFFLKKFVINNIFIWLIILPLVRKLNFFKFIFLPHEKEYFLAKSIKNPFIVDIGGGGGESIYSFKKVSPHCKIITFEPERKNYLACSALKKKFQNGEIFVKNFGLSDKNENKILYTPYFYGIKNLSLTTFSSFDKDILSKTIEKKFKTKKFNFISKKYAFKKLDNINFDKVDIMKIDVEGSELKVLKGAKKIIKKFEPIIIIEFASNKKELIKYINKMHGYKACFIKKNKMKVFNKTNYTGNIILLKNFRNFRKNLNFNLD